MNRAHIRLPLLLASLVLWPAFASAQSIERLAANQQFEAARVANDVPAAIVAGQRALQLIDSDPEATEEERADLLQALADVREQTGDFALADELLARAIGIREAQLGAEHPDLLPLLDSQVRLAQRLGDPAHAEALLLRILSIERTQYGERGEATLATLERLQQFYSSAGRVDDAARVEKDLLRLSVVTRDPSSRGGQRNERRYRQENGSATVRIFYGTNRAPTGQVRPASFYGKERGDLQFGYADVTVPETHRQGELETQSRWSILSFITDDDADLKRKYVVVQKVAPLRRDAFVTALRQQLAASTLKDVFVFVHGFNTSFDDAARRTAQLAYDLDFDGVPMLYSWPSQASTTAYTVDEAAVGISGLRMADFLETVVAQSGAQRVHLIAHSMGNRTLVEALQAYRSQHAATPTHKVFGQIVFTAPDLDRDYFVATIAQLQGYAERVTLYASDSDLALRTSQKIHGAPRAGLAGPGIVTAQGLDTIDMSGVKGDMLGHNYFAADAGAIYDLFRLLWRSEPPPQRCGMSDTARSGASVWIFNVSVCAGQDLLYAGVLIKRFGERARARVRTRLRAITDPTQKQEWSRVLTRLDSLLKVPDGAAEPPQGTRK